MIHEWFNKKQCIPHILGCKRSNIPSLARASRTGERATARFDAVTDFGRHIPTPGRIAALLAVYKPGFFWCSRISGISRLNPFSLISHMPGVRQRLFYDSSVAHNRVIRRAQEMQANWHSNEQTADNSFSLKL
jgi:hypothetical protein